MPRKGEYSNKYGFHVSRIVFNCGGEDLRSVNHGTLTTAGIEGAQPRRFTAVRSSQYPPDTHKGLHPEVISDHKVRSRPRNPLNPEYDLPPVVDPPSDPGRFIRDTLDVSDIPGTRAKAPKQGARPNQSLNTSDIQGDRPSKPAVRQPRDAGLNVTDIVGKPSTAQVPKIHDTTLSGDRLGECVGRNQGIEW